MSLHFLVVCRKANRKWVEDNKGKVRREDARRVEEYFDRVADPRKMPESVRHMVETSASSGSRIMVFMNADVRGEIDKSPLGGETRAAE